MTSIKISSIALALVTSLAALATSASAQPTRAERMAAAREARAQANSVPHQRYAPAYNYAPVGNAPANPNECRTDDGYGRYDTCDH